MRYQLSWPAALVFTSLLTGAAAPAFAQSLADVARKEAERRKTITGPAKVYTEKDLKAVPPPSPQPPGASANLGTTTDGQAAADGSTAATPDGTAAADGTAAPAGTEAGAGSTRTQADWASGMKDRQDKLSRDRVLLDSVQNRVNSLNTDFTARDDPAQRELIAQDRQRSLDELDRLRTDIAADEQAISDFEDEARKANVPSGWLRN
jgi:hypothetical protein